MIRKTNEGIKAETAIALGNFDGLHIGHGMLINTAKSYAAEHGLASAIFSFYPHPVSVLRDKNFASLTTSDEKAYILDAMGVDYFVEYPFDARFAATAPYDFVINILAGKFGCKALFVGESFRFGHNCAGDSGSLVDIGAKAGITTVIVPDLSIADKKCPRKVSSSWIRELVRGHEFDLAAELLTRPYFVMGSVAHGQKLGRVIGFPTANQNVPKNKLLPQNGVYVTQVNLDGRTLRGITNVGTRPTISDAGIRTIETHLLDFDDDIYGKEIRVEFLQWIRDEAVFGGIGELKERIAVDETFAREYLRI